MNWIETRKKLLQLATGRDARPAGGRLRALEPVPLERCSEVAGRTALLAVEPPPRTGTRPAGSICVASGKGGTGKSVVSASLATLLAERDRTVIIDADMGVGNAHILQDVAPEQSFVDVVEGKACVREALSPCSPRLDLVAAGSGLPRMAELNGYELHRIAIGLEELDHEYGFMVVDSAAGISRQTMLFSQSCDLTVIVTTPDLTAMTDAYAFLKVLMARRPEPPPFLLVNRSRGATEAREVAERIENVCRRFLGVGPRWLGWLPDDPAVSVSVNRRAAVSRLEPQAPVSQGIRELRDVLVRELAQGRAAGLGASLVREIGYSAKLR